MAPRRKAIFTGRRRPAARAAAPNDRVLIGVVLFCVAGLLAMIVLDRYVFVIKMLVVPVLLLAALLSGRFTRFINDWALFLGGVVFFDFCRGLAFAVTSHFELPMYLGYVVRWERWLCGGAVAPVMLQQFRAELADPVWLDRFFVLVYSSHFLFFLVFGFVLWWRGGEAFRRYAIALMLVMYGGLLVFFVAPTIPPRIAANDFLVLPPIEQIVRRFYNVHLPEVLAVFDTNPIAAMPSLHAALPATCALFALRELRRWGVVVVAYAVSVWVAIIYLGEHYLVDVIAGCLLALAAFAFVHRWAARSSGTPAPASQWALRPIAGALALMAATVGLGQLSANWIGPLPVTRSFVQRELAGRSILAHYLLGRIEFAHNNFAEAETELGRALDDLPDPAQQKIIRSYLAASAVRVQHYAAAIAALEPMRADADAADLVLLATAYVDSGAYEQGVAVLRDARARFPAEPAPLYWITRYQYIKGEIDRGSVQRAIAALDRLPQRTAAPWRKALAGVLADDRANGSP